MITYHISKHPKRYKKEQNKNKPHQLEITFISVSEHCARCFSSCTYRYAEIEKKGADWK